MELLSEYDIFEQPQLEYATFLQRAVAYVIDMFIVCAIQAVIIAGAILAGVLQTEFTIVSLAVLGLFIVVVVSVNVLYYALQESGRWQATVGKRVMGILVIDEQGGAMSFRSALGRRLMKYVSGWFLYLGYIMMLFDLRKQCLHDKVIHTLVIRESKKWQ